MAISDYTGLQAAIAGWVNKSNLGAVIPDFITLASTRIYYGSADPQMPSDPVRIPDMQARETPTLSSGTFSLPTRYIETIRLRVSDGNTYGTLDYVSPTAFAETEDDTNYARVYTILNNQVHFRGTAGTIVHDYYARFADFSAGTDTNALLTLVPSVWLWASLIEAAIYQRNDALAGQAYRMYASAVRGVNRTLKSGVMSSLAMRVR